MGKSSKKLTLDTASSSVPPIKKVKKGKRGSDEALDQQASSEKEYIEHMFLSKKKAKKLKMVLNDSPEKKKEESKSLDFVEEVAATSFMISQTRDSKKGKREDNDDIEKQESSKKQKIKVKKVVQKNKDANKSKKCLIESTGKMKGENCSSDFEDEVVAASIMISQRKAATKGKMDKVDETEKQASSKKLKIKEEVGQSNKKIKKFKQALNEPTGEQKDKTCSSDFEEEPEAPANQNEKCHAKRLFVGNLPSEVIKDDLLEFFKEAGKVIEIQLAAKEDGSFRGFGHVEFATAADAQRALGMNYQLLRGRRVMIDFAVEKGSNNPPKGKCVQDSAHCVFVKGFGKSLGEDEVRNSLKEHFGSCGEIIRISIPQDNKTGRSKGFAYILFSDQATVCKALELSGSELGSYTLTVEQPTPKGGATNVYRGGRSSREQSNDQGRSHGDDGGGRGRGRRGASYPYSSATTASKARKTTFDDNV